MHKGLFVLPIVFFTALCAFLVSYESSTAPSRVPAQIYTETASASEPSVPDSVRPESVGESAKTEKAGSSSKSAAELPMLGAYPELEGIKVNLNTAVESELQQLPGIGPKKAEAIIAYVQEHGPFSSVDELTEVSGIGEKTLENLRPYITVE